MKNPFLRKPASDKITNQKLSLSECLEQQLKIGQHRFKIALETNWSLFVGGKKKIARPPNLSCHTKSLFASPPLLRMTSFVNSPIFIENTKYQMFTLSAGTHICWLVK